MAQPKDAYTDGYRKGRDDSAGGRLAEVTMGTLRDDPGGHFQAGYRDAASGKKFTPPLDATATANPTNESHRPASRASDLEKAWYAICDGAFIPEGVAEEYTTALKAAGKHAAIVVGLSDFTGQACPSCGINGQFKMRFLGRIEHAGQCAWSGYAGTGAYIGFQVSQIVHTGIRAGGSMKDDRYRKGDRSGGWIYGIVGFMMVAIFRAALATVLIPFHIIASVSQSKKAVTGK